MPPSEVMSGRTAEAGLSWPREVFALARWGDGFAPWQCFAAWVLLTWVADPNDDECTEADADTVWSLTEGATRLSPEICAHAIAYLRWQAPARNEPGPTAFHELGIACLYAALFRSHPGQRLRDALDMQCLRTIEVADQDTLEAIDSGEIWAIRWPLDMTQCVMERQWRTLCSELLGPFDQRQMPDSAGEILRRMQAGV
ncbi:MAG: hypothetical protein HND58_17995 [Planctomycetota bacterium]|nr:MAG: hypothetical protein HND58_17995 [Planctomycetota bacterium]